jgi:phosphoribosylformylglycinamidine cyclo-ligase
MCVDNLVPELDCTLGEELLKVHPSYLEAVRLIRKEVDIKGIAHITGGGIRGNLSRVIPEECSLQINYGSWVVPPIFALIAKYGPVEPEEMHRVFNIGVGMALVLTPDDAGKISGQEFDGWKVFEVGKVITTEQINDV